MVTENNTEPARRDPLALSFEAHRRLLLLRLRWHASRSHRRRVHRRHRVRP
jgi:hypothetical protein